MSDAPKSRAASAAGGDVVANKLQQLRSAVKQSLQQAQQVQQARLEELQRRYPQQLAPVRPGARLLDHAVLTDRGGGGGGGTPGGAVPAGSDTTGANDATETEGGMGPNDASIPTTIDSGSGATAAGSGIKAVRRNHTAPSASTTTTTSGGDHGSPGQRGRPSSSGAESTTPKPRGTGRFGKSTPQPATSSCVPPRRAATADNDAGAPPAVGNEFGLADAVPADPVAFLPPIPHSRPSTWPKTGEWTTGDRTSGTALDSSPAVPAAEGALVT
jgi:hypothetical protein